MIDELINNLNTIHMVLACTQPQYRLSQIVTPFPFSFPFVSFPSLPLPSAYSSRFNFPFLFHVWPLYHPTPKNKPRRPKTPCPRSLRLLICSSAVSSRARNAAEVTCNRKDVIAPGPLVHRAALFVPPLRAREDLIARRK